MEMYEYVIDIYVKTWTKKLENYKPKNVLNKSNFNLFEKIFLINITKMFLDCQMALPVC